MKTTQIKKEMAEYEKESQRSSSDKMRNTSKVDTLA